MTLLARLKICGRMERFACRDHDEIFSYHFLLHALLQVITDGVHHLRQSRATRRLSPRLNAARVGLDTHLQQDR